MKWIGNENHLKSIEASYCFKIWSCYTLYTSLVHAIQKHNSIYKESFVCYVDQTVSSCKDLGKCAGFISKQLLCTTNKVANTERV